MSVRGDSDKVVASETLKRIRAGHLSNLKRKFNDFEESSTTADEDAIQQALKDCKDSFRAFTAAHHAYLDAGIDQEEIKRVSVQYQDALEQVLLAEGQIEARKDRDHDSKLSVATTSRSKRSTSSSIAARQRLVEARIKKQFQQQQHDLQRQTEEAQRRLDALKMDEEIAIAQGLLDIAEQAEQSEKPPSIPAAISPPTHLCSAPTDLTAIRSLAQAIRQGPSLPRIGLMKFDGQPINYAEFRTNFQINIEAHVEDDTERLIRLISQCTDKAADAIKGCINCPEGLRYKTAWKILQENFGQQHMIADAQMRRLKDLHLRKIDATTLFEFSRNLEDVQRTLKSLETDVSDQLNNENLIKMLMRKLPEDTIKRRWVHHVGDLLESNPRITFQNFIDFIKHQGQLLNNAYAEELQRQRPSTSKVMSVRVPSTSDCPQCKGPHPLWRCKLFKSLTIKERQNTVKAAQLCRRCLQMGHYSKECKSELSCATCKKPHNTLLHIHFKSSSSPTRPPSSSANPNSSTQPSLQEVNSSSIRGSQNVWFKVIPVVVNGPHGPVTVSAFLDNGSDTSLCTTQLLKRLGLKNCEDVEYTLSTLSGEQKVLGKKAHLDLTSTDGSQSFKLTCLSTPRIPVNRANVASRHNISSYSHLRDIQLPDLHSIDLLIGSDHADLTETQLDIRKGQPQEPIAIKTIFGWTVCGSCNNPTRSSSVCVNFLKTDSDLLLNHLHQLYDHEFSDLTFSDKMALSPDDQTAKTIMEDSAILLEGHYQIDLPFRTDPSYLRGNYYMAKQRLMGLKRRLDRDSNLKDSYKEVIQRYENEGACSVSASNASKNDRWFLPHHAVCSSSKPAPRVVFDCAAKHNNQSLNDFLLKGPTNTNSLMQVLLRFRIGPIAVAADIKSMFHQVHVPPEQRNKLSFLWWPTDDFEQEPQIYEMNVHIFGATSSPSVCEFALRRTAIDNVASHSDQAVNAVLSNFYVDDMLKTFSTVSRAIEVSHEVKDLLSKGGFNLTKWMSNSKAVLDSFPVEERAPDMRQIDLQLKTEKALGLLWDLQADTICNKISEANYPSTRRGVLASVAAVYDPFGIICPLTLKGKILNQELCLRKLEWDSLIPDDLQHCWQCWLQQLQSLSNYSIPRCFQPQFPVSRTELHHFADASETAYGTVSYIRFVGFHQETYSTFLYAKARVKPLKKGITIPRLELAAATTLVSVHELITDAFHQEIQFDEVFFWTDSMIVLRYIHNETKPLTIYVENRVAKIRDASHPSQWRHVKGSDNPADIASRGLDSKNVKGWETWFSGPCFLKQQPLLYPSPDPDKLLLTDDEEGVKQKHKVLTTVSSQDDFLLHLFKRYSSWTKLLRLVSWIFRAMILFKGQRETSGKPLTLEETRNAEKVILKTVQAQAFSPILSTSLKQFANLNPVVIDGLLCVGGRLSNANLPHSMKHPVILPAKHAVTKLLILHYHLSNGHCGAQHTLASLRQHYWIVKGLSAVRRITQSCHFCRRQNRSPGSQIMAPLPSVRVSTQEQDYPFAATGIDYFGPIFVSRSMKTRSQSNASQKRYGCIFTCLRTRALHLEIAADLSTQSFINVLLRFIARRGPPRVLYSDNGTNFRGAHPEVLKGLKALNQDSIQHYLTSKEIEWHFNPPMASHQGGVWERLIRSVRKVLSAQLHGRIVTEDVLHTYMCEVERILNDRPITKVSNDPNDLAALTPNHLLLLRRNSSVQFSEASESDKPPYKAIWRVASHLANEFWARWKREYLTMLQERRKWIFKRRNFEPGDLVLLVDPNAPRGSWPKGIIMQVFPSSDGNVREVLLRTSSGLLRRDIRKLCLLEEQLA